MHVQYRGALLNAVQSILTLPDDIVLPEVVQSFSLRDVRFMWSGGTSGDIVATFTDIHGYKMLTPGGPLSSVWHEDGQWLLDALRNAGHTKHKPVVRCKASTGIRALEVE